MRKNPILNLILDTDSYKVSQWVQYPPGTRSIFSYVEARGPDAEIQALYDRFFPGEEVKVVHFGLQYFIREYLSTPVTHADVDQAGPLLKAHGYDFNEKGWRQVVDDYNGWLPLEIRMVREGTVLPVGNILSHIHPTDERFFWLVSYLETAWMRASWYPSTVASNGLISKRIIKKFMDETADYEPTDIDFMMHDFGARGASSKETAGIGGMAHLVYFQGTDTITGALYAMEYYDAPMPGFSIPASEHSTITSWGKKNEVKAFANMLSQFGKDNAILACVSDSYDIMAALDKWAELKEAIENLGRRGGRLVVRPDSGDPVKTPVAVIERLMELFGSSINSKGYRVLPSYLRVIQGDGINLNSMADILERMKDHSLAANNIAFGRGAGTLQLVNRDNYGFAMKCSAAQINGEWHDVWKEAPGKASKRGRLTLVQNQETREFRTIGQNDEIRWAERNMLDIVYRNRPLDERYTNFYNVRSEAHKGVK